MLELEQSIIILFVTWCGVVCLLAVNWVAVYLSYFVTGLDGWLALVRLRCDLM